jgi:hypothetical protein
MTDYKETTRTRQRRKTDTRVVTNTYGICTSTADTAIPARGDYLDGATGASAEHAVCCEVKIDPKWNHGRVLVKGRWVGHEPAPTLPTTPLALRVGFMDYPYDAGESAVMAALGYPITVAGQVDFTTEVVIPTLRDSMGMNQVTLCYPAGTAYGPTLAQLYYNAGFHLAIYPQDAAGLLAFVGSVATTFTPTQYATFKADYLAEVAKFDAYAGKIDCFVIAEETAIWDDPAIGQRTSIASLATFLADLRTAGVDTSVYMPCWDYGTQFAALPAAQRPDIFIHGLQDYGQTFPGHDLAWYIAYGNIMLLMSETSLGSSGITSWCSPRVSMRLPFNTLPGLFRAVMGMSSQITGNPLPTTAWNLCGTVGDYVGIYNPDGTLSVAGQDLLL